MTSLPLSALGLPIINNFGVAVPGHIVHYVEISRLAVAKESRGSEYYTGLLHTLFSSCLEKGITHIYAVIENNLLNFLIRIGYPFKKIGDQRLLFGGYTSPVCLDLSEVVPLDYEGISVERSCRSCSDPGVENKGGLCC